MTQNRQPEIPGIASTRVDTESHARFMRALTMMHTHRGNAASAAEALIGDDPACIAAHCLHAALLVLAESPDARAVLAARVFALEAFGPVLGDHAARHVAAARAWLDGDPARAHERYAAIVADYPRDIMALTVAHALDFRLGRQRMLRDRIAQVLPEWHRDMPGYASVLAMLAFGLEENGQFRRAERTARRALALDPGHPGAIHVIAHVMEMQGRSREGLEWLAQTDASWSHGTGFRVHLAWHRALFQLDTGDVDGALATYDALLAGSDLPSLPALADASALLWRLELRGCAGGARWPVLARWWEAHPLHGARAFCLVHAMIAFAGAGWRDAAAQVLAECRNPGENVSALRRAEDALALPLCEALLAFERSDYAACLDHLAQVRHLAQRCGGSVAQCDLIHLTMTEAALRARQSRLARALTAERAAQRPESALNRLLLERALMLVTGAAA